VTGGAGFIGSHLVDRLLDEQYEVTAVDNLSKGRLENIAQLRNETGFHFERGDLRNERVVDKLVKGQDVIFHMAAHADVRNSLLDHKADFENNVMVTLNLLEAMVRYRVNELVFASSSAIYGEAAIRPTPEDYMPVQTSLYGASKLACEAYSQSFTQIAPIRFWAFRFANVIGERRRRGVIWDFVHKLGKNPKELEILGDGKQSKEYLYVGDCVEGMLTGYRRTGEDVNIFNLGHVKQTTVDEIASIVVREMKLNTVKRSYTGGNKGWIGDNPVVNLDISKMKSLGWAPKVSPEEAVATTAKWTIENP